MSCVFVSRYTHAISIVMKLLENATRNHDMKIVGGLTQALQTFLYLAALLFIQYNLNNTRVDDWKTRGAKEAAYWLTVEVLVLYFYIFAGVVYLVTVSCRGVCGRARPERARAPRRSAAATYSFAIVDADVRNPYLPGGSCCCRTWL